MSPFRIIACFPAALVAGISAFTLSVQPTCAAPGDLDAGFGTGGAVTTDFSGGNDSGYAVAVQSDGKILAAGDTTGGSGDFAMAHYLDNGDPDPSFGSEGNGRVTLSVGIFDASVAIAQLPDGNILVGGAGLVARGDRDFAVARLLPNGLPDPSFGSDGLATADIDGAGCNDHVYTMAVQPDGRVLLAGEAAAGFALTRFTTAGTLDSGFGEGGIVRTQIGTKGSGSVRSLSLQADGKILAAGDATIGGIRTFAVVRYLATGELDPGFGTEVVASANFAAEVRGVVAQADGTILLAGTASQNFLVFRLLREGGADPAFGNGGAFTDGDWHEIVDAPDSGHHVFAVPVATHPKLFVRLSAARVPAP